MSYLKYLWSKKNYRISFVISVLIVLWLVSGGLLQSDTTGSVDSTALAGSESAVADKPSFTVRARSISAEEYQTTLLVSGKTAANRQLEVRAEVDGRVVALPLEKGQQVAAGDVLCELAVEDRELRVNEAAAEVERAQLEYDGALQLKSSGFQSRTAIAASKAALETAKANLKQRQLELEKSKVRAPFAGYLDQQPVEEGDFMRRGDHCATILELDPLLITAQLSANELAAIKLGQQAQVNIPGREQLTARVVFISRSADPQTRTYLLEVQANNADYAIASGLTAQIRLPTGTVRAHLVSPSLLSLNDAGDIGVRILDQQQRVRFVTVTMVGEQAEGIWVLGLPETTLLITVGQEYVVPGQQVDVTLESTQAAGV